jgi:branched-chain amino acid transport system permease protein
MGPPVRLYYAGLILSVLAYLGFRGLNRTAFGLAFQGIRDDPVRMASLGYNVPLHRTLAFTLAGFVAGLAGLLNVWWNGQIDPASISIGPTLVLLIIAVIGGISHLEGAWLGAFVYVAANTYLRELPLVDRIGITEARFNTVIGVLVLLIMVLSPEGLVGIIGRVRGWRPRTLPEDLVDSRPVTATAAVGSAPENPATRPQGPNRRPVATDRTMEEQSHEE